MDPDAALAEIELALKEMNDHPSHTEDFVGAANELANQVEGLIAWFDGGGFRPARWASEPQRQIRLKYEGHHGYPDAVVQLLVDGVLKYQAQRWAWGTVGYASAKPHAQHLADLLGVELIVEGERP